jgi:hypothetical protein
MLTLMLMLMLMLMLNHSAVQDFLAMKQFHCQPFAPMEPLPIELHFPGTGHSQTGQRY